MRFSFFCSQASAAGWWFDSPPPRFPLTLIDNITMHHCSTPPPIKQQTAALVKKKKCEIVQELKEEVEVCVWGGGRVEGGMPEPDKGNMIQAPSL